MSDSTENTSKPSREQLEARVVALLLGEASPFEEEQLREQLKGDAALAKFCAEIEQTLPLLNEALDVGQAPKAKSPKPRLARKRRGKLKLLFRSDTGLAKPRIVRLDFRKTLAIAAAVCVVLFIAAGLLLPNLSKSGSNAGQFSANQTKGIADSEATQVAESKPNFTQDTLTATAGFSMVETGKDRPDSTLLGESLGRPLKIGGEGGQLALPTGAVSTHGAVVTAIPGLANGEATAGSVLNRSDYELSNSGERVAQLDRRKFAELSMPESEDRAETPNRAAYQKMAAGLVVNQQGQARDLGESKEMEGFGVNEPLAMAQKNPVTQSAPPAEEPVPVFEDGYARTASESAPKPADGVNLYGYREKSAAESGGQSAMTPKPMPYGMGESNFVQPPSAGAGESDYKSHGIDSLYSIVTAGEPTTKEFYKRRALNEPTILPVPHGAGDVADDNGRAIGWSYDIADKNADQSALNQSVNWDSGVHNKRNWAGSMADDLANEQLGERAEILKKDSLGGGMSGMGGMGMGGGGFAGGGGRFVDGSAMGNSPGMGMPESALPSSNSRFALAALPQPSGLSQPVSGGVAGSFSLDGDADGQLESNGQFTAFGRARSLEQGQLGLGTADFRTVDGRGDLQLSEGESRTHRQTVDATSGKKGYSAYDSSGQDVSESRIDRLAEITGGDQSGEADFYFDAQASSVKGGEPGYAGQREQVKEGRKAKETTLSNVPMLGGMFKNNVKSETAGRDLERMPQLRSADEKTRTQRSGSSRSSGRGRTLGLDRAANGLAKLSVVESESLVEAVDEAQLISGPGQRQLLAGKSLGANRKRIDAKKPQSPGVEEELLRGRGKQMAANKKLPAPKAKPQSAEQLPRLSLAKREENRLKQTLQEVLEEEAPPPTPSVVYTPRPETVTAQNNFSTFSLNVSDVSFKTTLASLLANKLPEPGDVRSEEFLNALEYRDPMPRAGEPLAFHWERARSPFTHDRDIIRFAVRTAALGRQPGRAINLVCLLDNSGSMEREDRVSIVQQALDVLARKLTPNDRVSLITFARTPKLRVDGMRGGNRAAFLKASTGWIPQGGTNVEDALALAYETAKKHFISGGNNRVVLLTDGAANMGNVDPYQLRKTVESHRKQGIALDCFGDGWDGYNDNLLEVLARNGDGRYGFLDEPAQAVAEFEQKLLGAFQVAASDVKVQVEWNANRVKMFRQVGYLRHQLKKEDFRNNKIDAAEISAAESGNALYVVQVNPNGEGSLGVVRVRYKVPFTSEYTEMEWSLVYESAATPLAQASPAIRLGSVATTFAEWLAKNPHAQGVQLADLQGLISGIPSIYGTDPRPGQLERMISKARILTGN
ncbi:MAG: von Willebrand factor type A domain-containing protein [Verrucomicrobiota bacterium]|nr:von Willebrand factor type A domain-containing protein [Verrucomicrobiota bacterium]